MIIVRIGAGLAIAGAVHAAVNVRLLRRPTLGAACATPFSVLIPARDEANCIASCVASVVGQSAVEVLVLDDESTDDTAALARAAGAQVLSGAALPPGWLGKPHACAQLAAVADPKSTVLIFVDADVVVAPAALAAAVELLECASLDLVSPHPRQLAGSGAERLVQPLLQWSILTFLPLRLAERSAHPALTAANGQLLVVRRSTYERAAGHAGVRSAVLDDLALARAIKRCGGRAALVDGTRLASCRMYSGWAELRDGYGKSLWAAFGTPRRSAAVLAMLAVAYVVPPVAALGGSRTGTLGAAAAVAGRVITARASGGRVWPDVLGHPASVALAAYLTLRSHVERHRGRIRWKGRPIVAA